MATSLSSMGGMGGSCGLQQRDPATAAAYPSYMFAHHGADPLSSLQSSYNQHQRAAAAAAACSAAQQASSAVAAHSYTNAHAQTGTDSFLLLFIYNKVSISNGLLIKDEGETKITRLTHHIQRYCYF